MADAAAMEFLRHSRVNNDMFYTDCLCCRKNFETFKIILMREHVRAQIQNPIPGEDCFLIFSRPEELACQDCEGLKHRFKRIWDTWYDIKKDREGFIILTCRPQAGLWLLKSTAVLGHFFTAEQQEAIQLRNGINCCL